MLAHALGAAAGSRGRTPEAAQICRAIMTRKLVGGADGARPVRPEGRARTYLVVPRCRPHRARGPDPRGRSGHRQERSVARHLGTGSSPFVSRTLVPAHRVRGEALFRGPRRSPRRGRRRGARRAPSAPTIRPRGGAAPGGGDLVPTGSPDPFVRL